MPPISTKKRALLSGVMTLVALLLFYFGYNFLKGINLFEQPATYYVTFANARDITQSTPVSFSGVRIGLVRALDLDFSGEKGVTVELAIDRNLVIPIGSKVSVRTNPLTGAELNIIKPTGAVVNTHVPGDTLLAFTNNDIIAQVSDDLLPAVASMIVRLDTLLNGFDRILTSPNIKHIISDLGGASQEIHASSSAMRRLMEQDIPYLSHQMSRATDNVVRITQRADSLNLQEPLVQVQRILTEIETLSKQLNNNEGTLGLMMRDPSLYHRLIRVSASADSLLYDLRTNPKRYVNFSLF